MQPYQAITQLLQSHSIPYDELNHAPVYTSQQAASIDGLSLDSGAKSLLLKADDAYVLMVLSGNKKFDSKKFKKILGVKSMRFATSDEVKDVMNCEIGSCYPFGSIIHIQTYIDTQLLAQPLISLSPGLHHKSIKLRLSDYLLVERPVQVEVSVVKA